MAKFITRIAQNYEFDFIVEADSADEAKKIAEQFHNDGQFWSNVEPEYITGDPKQVSDEEAEESRLSYLHDFTSE